MTGGGYEEFEGYRGGGGYYGKQIKLKQYGSLTMGHSIKGKKLYIWFR